MELIAVITGVILVQYYVLMMMVGAARAKTGIEPPKMDGDPLLERAVRIQANTLEQIVVVIPALWIFATYLSSDVAAGLGLVFVVGRVLYAQAYRADPKKRTMGFMLGFLATMVLLGGSLYGAIMAAI